MRSGTGILWVAATAFTLVFFSGCVPSSSSSRSIEIPFGGRIEDAAPEWASEDTDVVKQTHLKKGVDYASRSSETP